MAKEPPEDDRQKKVINEIARLGEKLERAASGFAAEFELKKRRLAKLARKKRADSRRARRRPLTGAEEGGADVGK